jgi:hypothetical protein
LDDRVPSFTLAALQNRLEVCDLRFTKGDPNHIHESGESSEEGEKTESGSGSDSSDSSPGATAPQFDKFLMFFTDCWPHAYAKNIFEAYKENAQIFLVDIPGAKYSHAIYTAYLTGQLTTNYEGKPIAGDHIVRSMKRSFTRQGKESAADAAYPMRYIGPEWSFLAIFGKDNYDTFFDQEVRMYKEALDQPFRHPYPFFFEPPQAQYWDDYRKALVDSGGSMMAHSGVMDHRQHGEHRGLGPSGTSFPRTDEMAVQMQSDMATIKTWIDANPEFLLVLASDHGVDEFDYAGYKMHGESANGNEPFILLYNPNLPAQGPKWIDVVDVAPTLTSYLRGVDIPMNALGMPHAFFGESLDARRSEAGMLKQSIVQLSKVAQRRGVSVDSSLVESILSSPFSDAVDHSKYANGTQLETLRGIVRTLKDDIYSVVSFPWVELLTYILFVSGLVLSLLLAYNDKLELFVIGENYFGFMMEMMKTLVVYAICFLQLMFCWWNWGTAADGGFVFRIMVRQLFSCFRSPLSLF